MLKSSTVYGEGKGYILFSLHKIGECIITIEEGCCCHITHKCIYNMLQSIAPPPPSLPKKKVTVGTLSLAPWLASKLASKKCWQKDELKGSLQQLAVQETGCLFFMLFQRFGLSQCSAFLQVRISE